MELTVGIASRNGLPHLDVCLAALRDVATRVPGTEFLLVDSASTDGTLDTMLAFARGRNDTRVLSMRGTVNLSATRNVILEAARPGAVFIVDGDVALEADFVAAAMEALRSGRADIVYGGLPEIHYDGSHRAIGEAGDRYGVGGGGPRPLFHGVVLLGPAVTAAGARYDARLARCEDTDLAVRLADRFQIEALPQTMGTHHTIPYYHADRWRAVLRQGYALQMALLVRKHLTAPRRLWRGRSTFAGPATGLVTQALLLAALASALPAAVAAAAGLMALDLAALALRGRAHHYVPVRLIGAWQLAWGLLVPAWDKPDFQVAEKVPGPW